VRTERLVIDENGFLQAYGAEHGEPVIRPGKILAIGLNYLDHIRETGLALPTSPLLFAKFPSTVIGNGQAIEIDEEITRRVDWEVELAVVLGATARYVSEDRALEYVYGYTVSNDVSARDLQFADGQWIRGKNLDTFCPLGPVIVTPDEIGDPQDLELWTKVNGDVVQQSTTAEMIFTIRQLIAFLSSHMTLFPGDVILTGTPWGCGEFAVPQRFLKPGDVMETGIANIGVLTNPIVAVSRVSRPSADGAAHGAGGRVPGLNRT
jgi:2-keto-4-pentenoate hydratase/2-oxohepta-3-ene-1,7-dioic acid hydratase in catechol pathway